MTETVSPTDLRGLFRPPHSESSAPEHVQPLLARMPDAAERVQRQNSIRGALLATSLNVTCGNFERISVADLEFLFDRYDEVAFGGCLEATLAASGAPRVVLRFSSRMLSSGGKTTMREMWRLNRLAGRLYEIAVSSRVVFSAFPDGGESHEPVTVGGLCCRDRLDVLLRVFEHELIHLFALLVGAPPSCRRPPFRALAYGLFGHVERTHSIVPPHVRNARESGLRPGDRVRFRYRSVLFEGVINRITRRATVLVEASDGDPYDDGRRYRKFYIPLRELELV